MISPTRIAVLALAVPVLLTATASRAVAQRALPTQPVSAALFPNTVRAPFAAPSATPPSNASMAPTPVAGPTADAARVGVAPRESKELTLPAKDDPHMGAGQNIAMMVVGGAALITGLIIGGDGGTIVAIGGAAVGLYGLYNYVK